MNLTRWDGETLSFNIDFSTGELTGRDALYVEWLIEASRGVASFPQMIRLPAPDARRNEKSMALLLLAQGYRLPREWAHYVPVFEPSEDIN